jgi:hypothetical protein
MSDYPALDAQIDNDTAIPFYTSLMVSPGSANVYPPREFIPMPKAGSLPQLPLLVRRVSVRSCTRALDTPGPGRSHKQPQVATIVTGEMDSGWCAPGRTRA